MTIESRLSKMRERAFEFAQARTSFQIEKFIGCDEITPTTRFRHLAHNSFMTLRTVKRAVLERERTERALQRVQKKQNSFIVKLKKFFGADYDLDIDIARLTEQIEDLDMQIKGGLAEVDVFEKLCDELEKQNGEPFSAAQLEAEEPLHWERKLALGGYQDQVSRATGVSPGNLHAMFQASASPILSGSNNLTHLFNLNPDMLQAVATAPMITRTLNK